MTQKYQLTDFLPTTRKECELRGWDELDVILFSGDAYVDHPSFGAAVIGRLLEAKGYKVAIVPQPDWHGDYRDFKKLGRPRLFFAVSAGPIGMVTTETLRNLDGHVFSLLCQPVLWTPWSTATRPTDVCGTMMLTVLMHAMTCDRITPASFIPRFLSSSFPTCP